MYNKSNPLSKKIEAICYTNQLLVKFNFYEGRQHKAILLL